MSTRLLLLGGSSEIAVAIATRIAKDGELRPFLIGRDRDRLEAALAQLEQAGAVGGSIAVLDADDLDRHEQVIAEAFQQMGGFDVAVLAVGILGAHAALEGDPAEALEVLRVNFLDSGSLMLHTLSQLRRQGSGTLVVLSSVAGERPRASLAVYAASKAGLDGLAQALADGLAGSGVRVLVVRPGFVRTRMTAGLKAPPMSTTPEAVAQATVGALAGNAHTVWVPGRLRFVFSALRHLPRPVFRRIPF